MGLVVAIVLFSAVIAFRNPVFLTHDSIMGILRATVYTFIIGVAATFVFISGGLDLSVGSVLALGGVISGKLLVSGYPIPLAILGGCAAGALVGVVNGVVIVYFKIPPLITTLGSLYVGVGAVEIITKGQAVFPFPEAFNKIGQAYVLGVPVLVVYAVVIGLIGHVVLSRTRFGYHVRATGGNLEGSRAMGVRVNRITVTVYIMSGVSAGFAGMLLASQLGSGQPSAGTTTNLEVIAAVIIGGTSLFGAIGSISGTALGALMLSVIAGGLNVVGLDPSYQSIVIGVVIVLAVGLDRIRRVMMFKRSGQT